MLPGKYKNAAGQQLEYLSFTLSNIGNNLEIFKLKDKVIGVTRQIFDKLEALNIERFILKLE